MTMTTRMWLRRPAATPGRPARPWHAGGPRRRPATPRRGRTPDLAASELERRELLTVVPKQFPIVVSPAVLPPDNKVHTVTFFGAVASTRPQLPTGYFHVTDEYRQYEPKGPVTLTSVGPHNGYYNFQFQFRIRFPAQRSTNTPDGRHFYVLIGAKDADNTDGRTVGVFVPKTYPPPQTGKPVVAGPAMRSAAARHR